MAYAQWSGLSALRVRLKNYPKEIRDQAAIIVGDVVEEAAWRMSNSIDRIETGDMKYSVGVTPVSRAGGPIKASFGWGVEGEPYHDYYKYQDLGFVHYISGKKIPPMHALLGATLWAREEVRARLKRIGIR